MKKAIGLYVLALGVPLLGNHLISSDHPVGGSLEGAALGLALIAGLIAPQREKVRR